MSAVVSDLIPVLRPMQMTDVADVYAIEAAAYDFPWSANIFRDCLRVGYYCCALEAGDALVGHGVMSIGAGECHLLNICIHPDYQRRGLGEQLVRYLLDLAYWQQMRQVYLEVRKSNMAAIRLYRRLGFEVIGVRNAYYPTATGKREDALILTRELRGEFGSTLRSV